MKKIFCLFLLSAYLTGIHAEGSSIEVISNTGISAVNIRIDQYSIDPQGHRIPFVNDCYVLPSDDIPDIIQITNKGEDAWIRVHLQLVSPDGLDVSTDMITLSEDCWKYTGGHWYRTMPLKTGETAEFMKSLHIPEVWTNCTSGKRFAIRILCDAVQYEHFQPDFESEDPWFGTVIEKSYTDLIPNEADDRFFEIIYKGGAEGLIKNEEDFFSNWERLVPGDIVTDTMTIRNSYDRPVRIFFRSETIADDDLIRKLKLTIRQGSHILFEGSLDEQIPERLIADLSKGEETKITYTLEVPEELDNFYAMKDTRTKWIFRCEIVPESPDTADTFSPLRLLVLMAVSLGVCVYLPEKERRCRNE